VGGRQYEVDNREHVEWMGRFIGRIHVVAKGTHFIHRPYISVDEYSVFTLQTLHNSSLIPSGLQQVVDLVLSLYISTKILDCTMSAIQATYFGAMADLC
jgi:Ser/Thr protein kinase RdoA (MazF antagonist)